MILPVSASIKSPLAISLRRATGFSLDSLHRIPGTVWRGAAAQHFLASGGKADSEDFKTLFLSGDVRFCDLRIDGAAPWPLSVRTCSLNPEYHTQVDLLLPVTARHLPNRECRETECGAKRQLPLGFRHHSASHGHRTAESVHTRRVAHVEIDPDLLRARGGQFHSSEVISPDQTFKGSLVCPEQGMAAAQRLLPDGIELFAGRGRTRGQGRIELKTGTTRETSSVEIGQRIRALNERIAQYPPLAERGMLWFSATLLSPAIVQDCWLLFRSFLEAADFGTVGKSYELQAWFSRTEEISGWHAAAGLPKSEVTAIDAGSCFLFAAQADGLDLDREYDRLAEALTICETWGVGERRSEGFGEVRMCDPIHWDLAVARDE